MNDYNEIFEWEGSHKFLVNGSGLHEDTLRIVSNYKKVEELRKLILPTLCITYAEIVFQNSVGGEQENYPAAQNYGPIYFDPPIEIIGEDEITRLTYIRGAHRVKIGPKYTEIEFPSNKDLVIPRLRIEKEKPIDAELHVPKTSIYQKEPLMITVLQYADGRHVGGVRIEKRHPKWEPPEEKEVYDLWLHIIDAVSLRPIPEVKVNIWHWDPKILTRSDIGDFRLDETKWTNSDGNVQVEDRPSGELEAYTGHQKGYRIDPSCKRPLAGEKVRIHIRAWPLQEDRVKYTWRSGDDIKSIAELSGHSIYQILRINKINDPSNLKPGRTIILPCYTASYRLEPWDTFDSVGKTFGYGDAQGLAEANGYKDPSWLDLSYDIKLPDWHFFYARKDDVLPMIDEMFDLPEGSTITIGRVFRPNPRRPYYGEILAVPLKRFKPRK